MRLDVGLRLGLKLARACRVAGGLGGGLHGLGQVGHELVRLAALRRGGRGRGGRGRVVGRADRRSRRRPRVVGRGGRGVDHLGRLDLLRRRRRLRRSASSPVGSAGASVSLRSELQGSRNPGFGVGRGHAVRSSFRWRAGASRGVAALWSRGWVRWSPLEVPAAQRRWYRRPVGSRGAARCGGRDVASARLAAHDSACDVRLASPLDHAGPAAARPADLGHGPLQLPLHVLHAQGGLRARLRVPAARPGPDVRGDRARGPGLRRARRREAAHHRR